MSDEQNDLLDVVEADEPGLSEDELLAQAMARMDSTPPSSEDGPPEPPMDLEDGPPEPDFLADLEPEHQESMEEGDDDPFAMGDTPSSLVLQRLDPSRRPSPRTICERCPNSVWFSTPKEVSCYCRVMFLKTWTSKEKNVFETCDGIFLVEE